MSRAPLRRTFRTLGLTTVTAALALTGVTATATAAPAVAPAARPTTAGPASVAANQVLGLRRGEQLVRPGSGLSGPDTLVSGGLPQGGGSTVYSGFGTSLTLQSDGNLVEYEATTGAVLFNANTSTGTRLLYQSDGNVVLYDAANHPLFSTGTGGDQQGVVFASYGNGQLVVQTQAGGIVTAFGIAVTPGPGVVVASASSPNGTYQLLVQTDGNVVAYNRTTNRAFWSTGSPGTGRVRLVAQLDGNLVVYSATTGRALWSSGSSGPTAYYQLDVQNDGNVVLYLTGGNVRSRAVWFSGTTG